MIYFYCATCNQKYQIEEDRLNELAIWHKPGSFHCSKCNQYTNIKYIPCEPEVSVVESNTNSNSNPDTVFDLELYKFLFNFSWMKYKHPAARLVNKLATIIMALMVGVIVMVLGGLMIMDTSIYKGMNKAAAIIGLLVVLIGPTILMTCLRIKAAVLDSILRKDE